VDVRQRRDGVGALADRAHDRALRNDAAADDGRRAELEQGHGVNVGQDRDRPAAAGDGADERDRAPDRRAHVAADGRADVDASMLPGSVRVRAEREGSQDGAVDRPRPRVRGGRGDERRQDGGEHKQPTRGRTRQRKPLRTSRSWKHGTHLPSSSGGDFRPR
jgi:hypothetical protein